MAHRTTVGELREMLEDHESDEPIFFHTIERKDMSLLSVYPNTEDGHVHPGGSGISIDVGTEND